ncbi:DUF2905 domain-containing protein [Desulfobacterota bacterium AH_259_B03_O07]|nr:DUF2905 domain-containing protein [Desulfobacterota bacterium AH_259_B03_O07]
MELQTIGKTILILGIFLVILGSLILFGSKIPLIGKLPGDIYIKRDSFTLYFPIASSILISIIITILLILISSKK